MPRPRVYLDYAASAPVRPELRELVEAVLFSGARHGLNPSSVHWAGQMAREQLESARTNLARRLARRPEELVFTSSGSEANNLALWGRLARDRGAPRRLVLVDGGHASVQKTAEALRQIGVEVSAVGLLPSGQIDLDQLESALKRPATLVSALYVNNETGVIAPVDPLLQLTRAKATPLHLDAVQAAGHLPLPTEADLITLSGHKFGALPGSGLLAFRKPLKLQSLIHGGPQERGHRAGTESLVSALAFEAALKLAEEARETERLRLKALQTQLESGLCALDGCQILASDSPRVPSITSVRLEGISSKLLLPALDLEGIAASAGAACTSGSLEPSPVLQALGLRPSEAGEVLRFSIGWASQSADIDALLAVLPDLLKRIRQLQIDPL